MNEGGFLISFLDLPKNWQKAVALDSLRAVAPDSLRSLHRRGEGLSPSVHVFPAYGWQGVCGQAFSSCLTGLCLSTLLAFSLWLVQKHPSTSPHPPSWGSSDANVSRPFDDTSLAELPLEMNSHSQVPSIPQWALQVLFTSMKLSNQEILSIFPCAASNYHDYFWCVCVHKVFPLPKHRHTLLFIWMKQQREFNNSVGNVKWSVLLLSGWYQNQYFTYYFI